VGDESAAKSKLVLVNDLDAVLPDEGEGAVPAVRAKERSVEISKESERRKRTEE
jgi:hypothetical protein